MAEQIMHGKWEIMKALVSYHPRMDWVGVHRDYDPTPNEVDGRIDDRVVYGGSVEEVKREIDLYEAASPG